MTHQELGENDEVFYHNGVQFIAGNGADPDKVRLSTLVTNLAISIAEDAEADYSELDESELVQRSAERLDESPLDDETRITALQNLIGRLNARQGLETDWDELPSLD